MLGLHVNRLTPSTRQQVLAYPWAVLKFLDQFDAGLLTQLKAQNPSVVTVGRFYYPDQSITPEQAVAPIIVLPAEVLSHIDYWETYNESHDNPAVTAQRNIACAALLHAKGLKFCALSLSVGTPGGDDTKIKADLDALWPGVSAADAWSYHSYGAPNILDNSEYLALRYRKYVQLDPRYGTKPLILSEGGIDFLTLTGQRGGYRLHDITDESYAAQLLALQTELAKDPYVLGCTIYQTGDNTDPQDAGDGTATWGSYCLSDTVVNLIGTHIMASPAPPPLTNPPPVDQSLAYFGMYGHTPNPETAMYKFWLLPLRVHALELQNQGQTNLANMVMPGPCLGEEYQVVEEGTTKVRMRLTNRLAEIQMHNGAWVTYQAELFK